MKNPFSDPKHPIDYGLLGKDVKVNVPSKKQFSSKPITINDIIDVRPALDGKTQTQNEWIEFYNEQRGHAQDKRMIDAGDIYYMGKDGSEELLASLRDDFKAGIITATRIIYDGGLSGSIHHSFKSTVVASVTNNLSEIPHYKNCLLEDALLSTASHGDGLEYLRRLFYTGDDARTIIKTLEKLSKKKAENIRVWTPDIDSRKGNLGHSVRFDYYSDNRFHVSNTNWGWVDDIGRSRGIRVRK